jgi:hypothetical protein
MPHPFALEAGQLRAYLPDTVMVNVSIDAQNNPVFHWGQVGARLERRRQGTLTGAAIQSEDSVFGTHQYAAYRRVWQLRECSYDYVKQRREPTFSFERLLLPLSRDGGSKRDASPGSDHFQMRTTMFDEDDLRVKLDAMSEQDLNALSFGVIKLGPDLRVRFFSETEARLSGFGVRPAQNLSFFEEVAPCMATSGLRDAAERALADGSLDLELGHTGDFADPKRLLRLPYPERERWGPLVRHRSLSHWACGRRGRVKGGAFLRRWDQNSR